MSFALYNLVLALIGAGSLATQRTRLPVRGLVGYVMAMLGLGLVLGFVFHQNEPLDPMFAAMRMWSYGLFVHVPLLCCAWAWLDRRRHPKSAAALGAVGIALAAVGVDAFFVEPFALEVNEVVVRSSKLEAPLTIAVLADIQSDEIGAHERAAVRAAVAAKPDLVLLPGDYVQAATHADAEAERARLRAVLLEEGLEAPLGAYAVPGNVDNALRWTSIFEGTGVRTATVSQTFHPSPAISVTALTLEDSFLDDISIGPQPGFHIVVGHGPDFALGRVEADLLVAGHTHGGQVRLPFIGPLVTLSRVPREWAAGTTALPGGQRLIVSRGIGLERGLAPRLRFLCRPEVVIVRVQPD